MSILACPYYESNCIGPMSNCSDASKCAKFLAYEKVHQPGAIEAKLKEMDINNNAEKMDIMLSMQKLFASRFHETNNPDKATVDKWVKEYLICIEDELGEAREYLGLNPDMEKKEFSKKEFNKELIDVLHFVMDVLIVSGIDCKKLRELYLKYRDTQLPTAPSKNDILNYAIFQETVIYNYINDNYDGMSTLVLINAMLDDLRLIRQNISWKHWKKASDIIDYDKLHKSLISLFAHLIWLFIGTGMTAESIFNIYVEKNIENIYRQEFGYLTGKK